MKLINIILSFAINFLLKIKTKLSVKTRTEEVTQSESEYPYIRTTRWVANISGIDAFLLNSAEPGVVFDSTKSENDKRYITFEINNDIHNHAVKGLKNLKNGFNISLDFLSSQAKILQSLKYKNCKLEYVDYGLLEYPNKNPHTIKFQCSCEVKNFSTVCNET